MVTYTNSGVLSVKNESNTLKSGKTPYKRMLLQFSQKISNLVKNFLISECKSFKINENSNFNLQKQSKRWMLLQYSLTIKRLDLSYFIKINEIKHKKVNSILKLVERPKDAPRSDRKKRVFSLVKKKNCISSKCTIFFFV